jgi:L-lactate permease
MGKKFNIIATCLLLVIGLRLMVHIEPILVSQSFGAITAFLLYLMPFIGVILRKRWGPAMSGVVGVLDLVMTVAYVRGSNMVGSAIADGALIFLSYLDYRQIAVKEKTGDLVIPTPGK